MDVLVLVSAVFLVVVAATLVYTGAKRVIARVTVWEHEKGLRYKNGKCEGVVEPGAYWISGWSTHITRVDMRPQQIVLPGQEVLSSDGIGLKTSIAARFQVTDPYTAVNAVQSYYQEIYLVLQLGVREIIGSQPIEELLEKRAEFDSVLTDMCAPKVEEFGLKLLSAAVRDIMFPGDLKKVFGQVAQARQEGLAALERARGETAALRNLANAAKMLDNNPSLLQLRMIQTLGESSGNTLVLGMSPEQAAQAVVRRTDRDGSDG